MSQVRVADLLLFYCCFTAVLLLLYCCFTAALLLLYCWQCPKCGQGIEKNEGCDHMTCKKPGGCGHEFCWRCLAPYDGICTFVLVKQVNSAPS